MKITKGMPEREYHALDRMSASRLKVLEHGTPAHLTAVLMEDRNTEAMRIGSALHCLALTPSLFSEQFAVAPDVDGRTKEGKQAMADFRLTLGDRTELKAGEYEDARNMAAAVAAHPSASKILAACPLRELTVTGEIEGIPAKCRIDLYSESGIIADLKTIGKTASPRNCAAYAVEYGVWLQMALYRRMKVAHHGASIVFVESKPPHCVAVRTMAAVDIERWDSELDHCIAQYRRWMENPDQGWEDSALDIPRWKSYEQEMGA